MFPANMLPLAVRAWHPAIMLLTGLCGILLMGYTAAGEDRHVKAKEKVVKKDGKIDYNDEEETQPGKVELIAGGKILIISKTFLPPKNGWKFKKFKKSTTHVDIWANPGSVTLDRPKDTATEIEIRGTFPVASKSAAGFPLRGEGNLTSPSRPGGTGGTGGTGGKSKGWHWSAKVVDVKVDLDICNGQGGAEVLEEKEELVGAFTVANLNDTDGDGKVDNVDDEVEVSAKGRDEVDLMKLILRKPDPDTGGNVTLRVVSGKVKFWRDSTKQKEFKKLEFPTTALPPAIWVEVIAVSNKVRDIKIEMSYKGGKDTVKATGVWAKMTKFVNAGNQTNIPADADSVTFIANIASYGNKFGAAHVTPKTNNGMLMEFQVMPAGIGNESQVVFDVTRRKESIGWNWILGTRRPANVPGVVPSTFPPKVEDANDDRASADEDSTPRNNHIYSHDHPGFKSDIAGYDRAVRRFNFTEFVRIKVNGSVFANNNGPAEGSRASNEESWRSRMDVVRNIATGKWERNGTDNEIKGGHKALGSPP